jgi:hypothetical protein
MKIFEARQLGEVTDKDRREAEAKKLHWDKNMKSFWLVLLFTRFDYPLLLYI